MFNWNHWFYVKYNKDDTLNFNQIVPLLPEVSNEEVRNHKESIELLLEQSDQIMELNLIDEKNFLGPFQFENIALFRSKEPNSTQVLVSFDYDTHDYWVPKTYFHNNLIGNFKGYKELEQARYEKLNIIASPSFRDTQNPITDLLETEPRTKFIPLELDTAVTNENSKSELEEFVNLLDLYYERLRISKGEYSTLKFLRTTLDQVKKKIEEQNNEGEIYLVLLNLFDALTFLHFSPSHRIKICQTIKLILNTCQGYLSETTNYVFQLYYAIFSNTSIELREDLVENLPVSLHLMLDLFSEKTHTLESLLNLTERYVSSEVYYRGYPLLNELIGNHYFDLEDFEKAQTYYSLAKSYLIFQQSNSSKKMLLDSLIVNSMEKTIVQIHHAALYALNTLKLEEAKRFSWTGLLKVLELFEKASQTENLNLISVNDLFETLRLFKRILVLEENEMTPVIDLKITLLIEELSEIFEKQTLTLNTDFFEMHRESLSFIVPRSPIQFLFLTTDGRLLFNIVGSHPPTLVNDSKSHLLAGVLTAVRSIFLETSFGADSSLHEINAGENILFIDALEGVVVVASNNVMNDNLRSFVRSLTKNIMVNFGKILNDWDGSLDSISMVQKFALSSIEEFINE